MKKLLFTAVFALALAGVATAADSTQFGVLTVESSAKRTLVGIPWVEASTAGTDIAVSNLILTANLSVNDTLDVLDTDGTSLNRWTLVSNGGVKYWASGIMVTESWQGTVPPSNAVTIRRGSSVVLIRQKVAYAAGDTLPEGKSVGDTIPFYVMGQVAATDVSTTITAGEATSPCYNMIAPPSTVAQGLNGGDHGATWTGTIKPEDRIVIPGANGLNVELMYSQPTAGGDLVWCKQIVVEKTKYGKVYKSIELVQYDDTIPVGTGIWYLSYGGSPTVTWKDVPVVSAK